jgi:hypothetical protein
MMTANSAAHKLHRLLAVLGCWLLMMMPGHATAQSPASRLTLDEYQALLTGALHELEGAPLGNRGETLQRVRAQVAAVKEVILPSGEVVMVAPLLGDAENPVRSRRAALARLTLVTGQLAAASGDATGERLALLEQVLARPEFNSPAALLERWLTAGREWLRRLLGRPAEGDPSPVLAGAAQAVPWVLAALGALLAGWLLSFWLQGLLRSFVADAEVKRRRAAGEELPLTAAEARRQAHSAAQSGRYRDAVRRLYLAALLHLQEQRIVPPDPSLTNHELLDRVPADAPIHAQLAPVVETFDQVWYGVREPSQATYVAYAAAVDELEAGIRAHAPAASG